MVKKRDFREIPKNTKMAKIGQNDKKSTFLHFFRKTRFFRCPKNGFKRRFASKQRKTAKNGQKWPKMAKNHQKWRKWQKTRFLGLFTFKMTKNGRFRQNGSKNTKNGQKVLFFLGTFTFKKTRFFRKACKGMKKRPKNAKKHLFLGVICRIIGNFEGVQKGPKMAKNGRFSGFFTESAQNGPK